jgi:hypothetical protein
VGARQSSGILSVAKEAEGRGRSFKSAFGILARQLGIGEKKVDLGPTPGGPKTATGDIGRAFDGGQRLVRATLGQAQKSGSAPGAEVFVG